MMYWSICISVVFGMFGSMANSPFPGGLFTAHNIEKE